MAEQQAPEQEATIADTPVEGTSDQTNWEERYKEAQAWGTRNAQRAAELETEANLVQQLRSEDWTERKAALETLGIPVEDDDEIEPDTQQQLDPRIAAKLAKIDELDQWRESLTTEQQQEQHYSSYREQVDPQFTKLGVPESFLESVADIAYNQLPAIQTPQGPVPDVEGAVKQFKEVAAMFAALPEVQQTAVEGWRKGKKAPHMSPTGREGTEVPDLSTPEGKVAYVMSRLHEEQ